MFKIYFLLKSFLYFIPTTNKKRWFLNELVENNIEFKHFLGFFLIKEEDKEFVDYLLPKDFFLIRDVFFKDSITSQSLQYIYEKAFSKEEVIVFSDLINYIAENGDLDLLINYQNSNQCECRVIYKDTRDILFLKVFNFKNAESLKEEINDFICSDVKIGQDAFEKIKKDIFNHYLSGFAINFNDYSVNIIKNSEDDFSIVLENEASFKKIIINHAKLNEKTGIISFAGNENGVLYF